MKIKSNDRMPPRSDAHVKAFVDKVLTWDSPHRKAVLRALGDVPAVDLFEVLHSARRWYSGQTMARKLLEHREILRAAMKLEPQDALGVFRGFKVDKTDPLAQLSPGAVVTLPVTRNHGFSSWSTTEAPTHRFSGGGKGKVGLVVRLLGGTGITPVLAPPERTKPWFNALYSHVIGDSFRPTEGEYLISAPKVKVQIVRVKR